MGTVRHILCATHAELSVGSSIGDLVTHSVTPFDFGTQRATLETCYLETFDQSDEETCLDNILTIFLQFLSDPGIPGPIYGSSSL